MTVKLSEEDTIALQEILKTFKGSEKKPVVLDDHEIQELKEWLADKKAIGRVFSIFKTILITTAGIVIAWMAIFNGPYAWLKNILLSGGAN